MLIPGFVLLFIAGLMAWALVVEPVNLSLWLLGVVCAWAGADMAWFELRFWWLARAERTRPVIAKCEGFADTSGGGHRPIGQCGSCQRFSWDCGFPGDGGLWIDRPPRQVIERFNECPFYLADESVGPCGRKKPGWRCTRHDNHPGPCAAVPTGFTRIRCAWRFRSVGMLFTGRLS